jgi:hypothetical protein
LLSFNNFEKELKDEAIHHFEKALKRFDCDSKYQSKEKRETYYGYFSFFIDHLLKYNEIFNSINFNNILKLNIIIFHIILNLNNKDLNMNIFLMKDNEVSEENEIILEIDKSNDDLSSSISETNFEEKKEIEIIEYDENETTPKEKIEKKKKLIINIENIKNLIKYLNSGIIIISSILEFDANESAYDFVYFKNSIFLIIEKVINFYYSNEEINIEYEKKVNFEKNQIILESLTTFFVYYSFEFNSSKERNEFFKYLYFFLKNNFSDNKMIEIFKKAWKSLMGSILLYMTFPSAIKEYMEGTKKPKNYLILCYEFLLNYFMEKEEISNLFKKIESNKLNLQTPISMDQDRLKKLLKNSISSLEKLNEESDDNSKNLIHVLNKNEIDGKESY